MSVTELDAIRQDTVDVAGPTTGDESSSILDRIDQATALLATVDASSCRQDQ